MLFRSVLHEEGRLKGHIFLDNESCDLLILALYRAEWADYSARWLESRRGQIESTARQKFVNTGRMGANGANP